MNARLTRNRFRPGLETFEARLMLASDVIAPVHNFTALVATPTVSAGAPIGPVSVATTATASVSLSGLLDTKIVPYDLTTRATLTFDLGTGSYYANAEVAQGLTYDTDKIKELLQ